MPALRWLRLLMLFIGLSPLAALAWDRGDVERFATLPAGSPAVEGITLDKAGNVYAPTFDPSGHHPGQLIVFDKGGNLVRAVDIAGASTALLGLDFHPTTGKLLVIDFGAGKVLT